MDIIAKLVDKKISISGNASDNVVNAWTLNNGQAWKWFGTTVFKDGWWISEKNVPTNVTVGTEILVQRGDEKAIVKVSPPDSLLNITYPYIDITNRNKLLGNTKLDPLFVFDNFARKGEDRSLNNIPYPGTIKISCDGGGIFNKNGVDATEWVEDSFWKGGYWGTDKPGIEAPLSVRWREFIPEKVKEFARQLKAPMHVVDIEHWEFDIGQHSEELVQNNINKMKHLFALLREGNPNVQYSLYGLPPFCNFWPPSNYYTALKIINEGHPIPEKHPGLAWWKAKMPEFKAEMDKWQKINDRLTYDVDLFGKRKETGGLLGIMDFLSPSLYINYNRILDNGYQFEDSDITGDVSAIEGILDETIRIGNGKPFVSYMMFFITEFSVGAALIKDANGKVIGYDMEKLKITEKRWKASLEAIKKKNSHLVLWGWDVMTDYISNLFNIALKTFGGYYPPHLMNSMSSGSGIGNSLIGDITGDGKVNFDDLLKLAQNYGK
jgi:hypothetical protein